MATLKELTHKKERLTGGHRLCAGCAASVVVRQVLFAVDYPVVVGCATGCLEVATTIYPYTAWDTSYIHNAFENVAATISGVQTAYESLKNQGKIKSEKDVKFIAFGGDGGTYDIGLQSLSGAMERGHNMLYICYDNQGYMNTGIQRSSATPRGAATTTAPAGKVIPGKMQRRKDLTTILTAHHIPYAAQTAPHHWKDLTRKVEKAINTEGPTFLNILSPCHRGWRMKEEESIDICRVAVDTCFWPLYEVEDGNYKVNYKPKEKKPITDFLVPQGRFKHILDGKHDDVIAALQADVDREWARLLALEELDY
jgi:pyruvate ferredoxin oxidoreductase beta subunit